MIKRPGILKKNVNTLNASGFNNVNWHIYEFYFLFFIAANTVVFIINIIMNNTSDLLFTSFIALIADILFLRSFYRLSHSYFELSARTATMINYIKSKHNYVKNYIDNESLSTSVEEILKYLDSMLQQEYSAKLLQKQAEFESIVSQINPHFLYNTLDSIRGNAVLEKASKSAEMIELLSRIFRYTISQGSVISLEQEINNAIDYIKLQQHRFDKQLDFEKEINCERDFLLRFQVPKLILQPIVENAIIHGLPTVEEGASIKLRIYTTQSRIIISIIDNGCGMNLETLNSLNKKLSDNHYSTDDGRSGIGVGLWNVNARIKLLFGNEYGITAFSSVGNGAEFQIILPLNTVHLER